MVETQRINNAYRELMLASKNTVTAPDNAKIKRAFDLAVEACGERTILTGEPEILHALSVARIIAGEMGLGVTSIITSLLHDSYNSLSITPDELEKEFGRKVVEILNGFRPCLSWPKLNLRVNAAHLRQSLVPILIEIVRFRIPPLVLP